MPSAAQRRTSAFSFDGTTLATGSRRLGVDMGASLSWLTRLVSCQSIGRSFAHYQWRGLVPQARSIARSR